MPMGETEPISADIIVATTRYGMEAKGAKRIGARTMKCPSCGGFVQDGAIFCTACGARMGEGVQSGDQAHQPPPIQQYVSPGGQAPPYPYQQPYQYQPPPKDDAGTAVKVVVVVVLVIIIMAAVMGAIIWFGISNMVPDPNPNGPTTLVLGSPSVIVRDIGNVSVWDATIEINQVRTDEIAVMWPMIRITVRDSAGTVLMDSEMPLPDDPSDYDDATDGWVETELWYVETAIDGFIEAGDGIKITGMHDRYEGATVNIDYLGDRIGSITLPIDFP